MRWVDSGAVNVPDLLTYGRTHEIASTRLRATMFPSLEDAIVGISAKVPRSSSEHTSILRNKNTLHSSRCSLSKN